MKIYMNLYSNSRFVIETENFELKELTDKDGRSIPSDNGGSYSLKIVAYDTNGNEHNIISEKYFNETIDIGNKRKYLLKIMDSISEDFINGYHIPDFKGLVQKAIRDVKEENRKRKE